MRCDLGGTTTFVGSNVFSGMESRAISSRKLSSSAELMPEWESVEPILLQRR